MAEISEKFLEDVLLKKSQEVYLGETHINSNKQNQIEEQAEKAEITQAAPEESHSPAANQEQKPEKAAEKSEAQPNSAEAEPKAEETQKIEETKIKMKIEELKAEAKIKEEQKEEELKAEVKIEDKNNHDDNAEKEQVDALVEEKVEVQQPAADNVVAQENPAVAAEAQ